MLGPDHPNVASGLNNLALLLWRVNRLDEAIPYQERATAIRERRGKADKLAEYRRELDGLKAGEKFPYGSGNQSQDPDLAAAIQLHERAEAAASEGKYAEAEVGYKQSLVSLVKALGPDDPNVAAALNNLALLLWRVNRLDEAIPYQERATAIRELRGEVEKTAEYRRELDGLKAGEKFPYGSGNQPQDPDLAAAIQLHQRAEAAASQGKFDEAEACCKQSLASLEKALGPDDPNVAASLKSLAALLSAQGKYDEALPLAPRSAAIFNRSLGPDHPHTQQTSAGVARLEFAVVASQSTSGDTSADRSVEQGSPDTADDDATAERRLMQLLAEAMAAAADRDDTPVEAPLELSEGPSPASGSAATPDKERRAKKTVDLDEVKEDVA